MIELAIRITRNSTISRHHDIEAAHWDTWMLTRASHARNGGWLVWGELALPVIGEDYRQCPT